MSETVVKHGDHNQKDHAGKGGVGLSDEDFSVAVTAAGKGQARYEYNVGYEIGKDYAGRDDLPTLMEYRTKRLGNEMGTLRRIKDLAGPERDGVARDVLRDQGFLDGATGAKRRLRRTTLGLPPLTTDRMLQITSDPLFGKSVEVNVPAEWVAKHGSHDQSTHGRRFASSVDPSVAASVLERVKANGGLSVNMVDGSEPTSGYMVAKGGTKGTILEAEEFFDPAKGPAALSAFVKEYRADLGSGKSYLGLWHNTADGKVYLDVSDNIMDRDRAVRAGKRRNQISIWDVANFQEIQTGGTGELSKGAHNGRQAAREDSGSADPEGLSGLVGRGDRRLGEGRLGEDDGQEGPVAKSVVVRVPLRHSTYLLKHLPGQHDQKTHARGGGKYDEWGDRAAEIEAMENVGPSIEELEDAVDGNQAAGNWQDLDSDEVYEYIDNDPDIQDAIDERVEEARAEYEQFWTERGEDPEADYFYDDFYENDIRAEAREEYVDLAASRIMQERIDAAASASDGVQELASVYDVTHSGTTISGRDVTIQARGEEVIASDGRIFVIGALYDADGGFPIGKFQRSFFRDKDGKLAVEHNLLRFEDADEYGGTGFAKVFNRQAENYYISHGIEDVHVFTAWEGGYVWAKQGFGWKTDAKGQEGIRNIVGHMNRYTRTVGADMPAGVSARLGDVRTRLTGLKMDDPDYPTPMEVSMIGYVQGANDWPGKTIMVGANWYGIKNLTPAPTRQSTTEQALNEARAAAQPMRGQGSLTFGPRDGDGDGRVGTAEARDDRTGN